MQFVSLALQLIPMLIQAGTAISDIKDFAEWAYGAATKEGGPTEQDWTDLHSKEDAARAALQKPVE